MNLDTLQNQLASARHADLPKIPKGWKTCEQWANSWNISESQTRKLLRDAVKRKIGRKKTFKVPRQAGVGVVDHYFLDSKAS